MIVITRIAPVLAVGLLLTGCATAPEPGPDPQPVTVTATASETETATVTATDSPAAEPEPLPYHAQPGDPVTIRGQAATVCVNGDGYGINVVAAGESTSCEFGLATLAALTEGSNPTHDNVRALLPRSVTAHSPVTGQDYLMSCRPEDSVLVSCSGGRDAHIWMY